MGYTEELIEDCPDETCDGFLVGNTCHNCNTIWGFVDVAEDANLGADE